MEQMGVAWSMISCWFAVGAGGDVQTNKKDFRESAPGMEKCLIESIVC